MAGHAGIYSAGGWFRSDIVAVLANRLPVGRFAPILAVNEAYYVCLQDATSGSRQTSDDTICTVRRRWAVGPPCCSYYVDSRGGMITHEE